MKCELACRQLDDYIENRLGRYERQRLETHLRSCPHCAAELQGRRSFERQMWQALAVSVQTMSLSPHATSAIVREVQCSVQRAAWPRRIGFTLRLMANVAMVALFVLGAFVLLGQIPIPSEIGPVSLRPAKKLALSPQRPIVTSSADQPILLEPSPVAPSDEQKPALSLARSSSLLGPQPLTPGQPFTVTVFLNSELDHPLDSARFDLDVFGPTGTYHFPLTVRGPLPAHGVTVLRVTSDFLAQPCEEKYLISPEEIFGDQGLYTVSVTLFKQLVIPQER